MTFDAIAFDLDGTLYPNRRLYARVLPLMLSRARKLEAFNAARWRMRAMSEDPARPASSPRDRLAFRALQAELVARRLGMDEARAADMIEREFYRDVEELFAGLRPYEGLDGALRSLQAAGLRLALLSDLPPTRKLELMGLAGRFEAALCSEDSGFLKPAAEPFAMLAGRLGLAPGRILYVGNSAALDVVGAKRAGMAAAIVSRRRIEGADLSFFEWEKLVEFVTASR
jgi:putative hydrolase of the HAD superfamily